MKWLLAVVVLCWGVAACDDGQVPTSPDPSMAVAAGAARVTICHYDEDFDRFFKIKVAPAALPDHIAHGDPIEAAVPLSDHSGIMGTDCVAREVVLTGTPYNVGPYGDLEGGSPTDATHQCPAGSVAVGMEGFWGPFVHSYNSTVGELRYRCAPLNGDGTLGTPTYTAYTGAGAGFYSEYAFDEACTGALVGVFGYWYPYLNQVGGRCGTIANVLVSNTTTTNLGPWGQPGSYYGLEAPFSGSCAAGDLAIGMVGRGGAGVNAVGLTCRHIVLQPMT